MRPAKVRASRFSPVITVFVFRTVYFVRSSAEGFVQRHIVDVVARVGVVGIVVVRFIHSARRLGVEERRQFLEQRRGENCRYSLCCSTPVVRSRAVDAITLSRAHNIRRSADLPSRAPVVLENSPLIYSPTRARAIAFRDDILQSTSFSRQRRGRCHRLE